MSQTDKDRYCVKSHLQVASGGKEKQAHYIQRTDWSLGQNVCERAQNIQASSYKISKSQGWNIEYGDPS